MSANVFIRSALSTCTLAAGAMAQTAPQTLRIGLSSEPTAMDPHYHQVTRNDAMTSHIFETLIGQDAKMNLVPRLATAWKAVDDTTWEFTLREGVKFSNGQPFTPQDVIFTLCRALHNEQSIGGSYLSVVQKLASIDVRDGNVLVIKTHLSSPLLPNDLTLSLADLPSIPLHFESSIWAFRKGLTYEGRADQYTLAMSAKPAN